MRCPNCGQDNPPEAKFCGKCATRLGPPAPPHTPDSVVPATTGEVPQGLKIGVIAGSILIPLLGIIMGLIYMNDANPAKKAVGKTWLWVGVGAIAFWCVCAMLSGMMQNL